MNTVRTLSFVSAFMIPAALALLSTGCPKKDSDPVPTAAVSAAPAPTPSAPVVVAPEEDAGSDAGADAGVDAGHHAGGGGDPTGIKKCCQALRNNAQSAPLDQRPALLGAAGMCEGMVNNPQGRTALAALRGMLRGASMPSACQ